MSTQSDSHFLVILMMPINMKTPKQTKPKEREPKREKPEEHEEHQAVSFKAFKEMIGHIVRVPPLKKDK